MNIDETFKAATETPVDGSDLQEMVSKLKAKCSQAVNTYLTNGTVIIRIFEMEANRSTGPDITIWNGNQSGRTSKNTTTYYNEFIDNLPEWGAYPKRSKSLICSMLNVRGDFPTNSYVIFPFDDVPIGLCPNNDIWYSFASVENAWEIGFMNKFGEGLNDFFKAANTKTPEDNWASMVDAIQAASQYIQATPLKALEAYHVPPTARTKGALGVQVCKQKFHGDVMRYFAWLLNPNTNNFEVVTPQTMDSQVRKECWLSGKCFIIAADVFKRGSKWD